MAGARVKSKLKEIIKARGGPSDNSDEVNNKSVEEVNILHSAVYMLFIVREEPLTASHDILVTRFLVHE